MTAQILELDPNPSLYTKTWHGFRPNTTEYVPILAGTQVIYLTSGLGLIFNKLSGVNLRQKLINF